MNEPSWLQFIGDRGVRTLEDAARYLAEGPLAMYERCGYGLYLVEAAPDGTAMGMCGLIRRESLPDTDLGFAFLPEFWGRGFAREAAAAVLDYGRHVLGLRRILAVTSIDNERSIRLLEKISFRPAGMVRLSADEPEIRLFSCE